MPELSRACSVCERDDPEVKLRKCSRCKNRLYCGDVCQKSDWPSHKGHCKFQNYILKVTLNPGVVKNPSISRTLSCPATATFEELHEALQIAFGWATTHSYDFKVRDPMAGPELRISMEDYIRIIENRAGENENVWGPRQNFLRIIDVDGHSLDMIYMKLATHPATPEVPSTKITLAKVFENKDYKSAKIEYEYDFTSRWRHEIAIVGRTDADEQFVCTDGEGHGAAEDCGSQDGWEELKTAYRTASPNKDQQSKMEWFETEASNNDRRGLGDGRDRIWDRIGVNVALARFV